MQPNVIPAVAYIYKATNWNVAWDDVEYTCHRFMLKGEI